MKSKKENEKGSALSLITGGWNPPDDDPHFRAMVKKTTAMSRADTPPEKRSTQALLEWLAEFVARLDAADAAAATSPIRRAERKNRLRSERVGKIWLAPKAQG